MSAGDGPIRVLLVDDQPLFRRAIASLLDARDDFTVVGQGENGLQGVELALELRPDVMLCDVEMPVMTGVEAATRVLAELPATKVVLLTVSEDDDYLIPAIRAGVHGYLLKDMHPDQLFETLRGVAHGESPLAPKLVGRLMAELRGSHQPVPADEEPAQAELSARELEIMRLVADGLSNREIGRRLSITEGTVKNHVHNALGKLGMENRIQAAAFIVRRGLGGPGTH